MKQPESKARRFLVIMAFAAMLLIGAALWFLASGKSRWHGLGIALLIAWVPGMGWFLFFFAKKRDPIPAGPRWFEDDSPLEAHATVRATFSEAPDPAQRASGESEFPCILLLGTEGFTSRVWSPALDKAAWTPGSPLALNLQLLVPSNALPKLPPGTVARLLVGRTVVGSAEVVSHAASAA
jgi:hypothetical protein